jgi:hypothetical protein
MDDAKSGRGGYRPGAGRKPLPPEQKARGRKYKMLMTSLPPDVLALLDDRVADQGSTRAAVMREIITAALQK